LNPPANPVERVIGLDAHPDSFTAAVLRGPTPAAAITEKLFNKVPIGQLQKWARQQLNERDLVVLEASGNSFHIARSLQAVGLRASVLESCQLGKLKEAHANNDKISAVRIAKAYLAGTAKTVWIPDPQTQERRDLFHHHRKVVKRTTQIVNRLHSYLSDNGVRLAHDFDLDFTDATAKHLRGLQPWTPRQRQVLDGLLLEGAHAQEQREHWSSVIALEVASDPLLLSLVRLAGIRDIVAFALGACIGDIQRFSQPKKLVKYVGLNPAFDDSGEGTWSGGIGGHGHKPLRALLMESAQSILRSPNHPLAKWGRKLLARKGVYNLAVAAVARRLVVSVWYLMMGRAEPVEQIDPPLRAKLGKIAAKVGAPVLDRLGKDRKSLRQDMEQSLRQGRVYQLHPRRAFVPSASQPRTPSPDVAEALA
jgi:transposase